jgi:Rap1a immunity proteins
MANTRKSLLPLAVLLIVALAVHPASAWAGPSGRTLLDQCLSSLTLAQASCSTYIEGLMDGHLLSTAGGKGAFYCVPPGHAERAKKIIVKYLKKNAAELERPAGELAFEALASAWPCH